MAEKKWGAEKEIWDKLIELVPHELFPTVNNPEILSVSKDAGLHPVGKSMSKSPSAINKNGQAFRMQWGRGRSFPKDKLLEFRDTDDLGVGMRCETINCMDLDIDDQEHSDEVYDFISEFFDRQPHYRCRHNSGSKMIMFKLILENPEKPRRGYVLKTIYGAIEFKFSGQFAALAGRHHTGAQQVWELGLPQSLEEVQTIEEKDFDFLIEELHANFGEDPQAPLNPMTSGLLVTQERKSKDADEQAVINMIEFLQEKGMYRGQRDDGAIMLHCPWQHQHESTDGKPDEDPEKVLLFPPGVGGVEGWGFKCMHLAGHGDKSFIQWANKVGYTDHTSGFEVAKDITPDEQARPAFVNETRQGVPCQPVNIKLALGWSAIGYRIAYDTFMAETLVSKDNEKARPIKDEDYTELLIRLQTVCDIRMAASTRVREHVSLHAHDNSVDSARVWYDGLRWDGVDRLSEFHTEVLKANDTPYNQAVVMYLFTALAGRCASIQGIKADIVPVLIGKQGCGKSTLIKALAPKPEYYRAASLTDKDDDLKRQLRGSLVVELSELNGLSKRSEESNKAWITEEKDVWVPKFKENPITYARRWIPIGSSNVKGFLKDPTGARRWAPIEVGVIEKMLDSKYVKANITQLWAQGKALFETNGIMYKKLEKLAKTEHEKYTVYTVAYELIRNWLAQHRADGFSTIDVLQNAIGVPVNAPSAERTRVQAETALTQLGFVKNEKHKWVLDDM